MSAYSTVYQWNLKRRAIKSVHLVCRQKVVRNTNLLNLNVTENSCAYVDDVELEWFGDEHMHEHALYSQFQKHNWCLGVTRWHRVEHNSVHFIVGIMVFPNEIMEIATIIILYQVHIHSSTNDSINVSSAHHFSFCILLFIHNIIDPIIKQFWCHLQFICKLAVSDHILRCPQMSPANLFCKEVSLRNLRLIHHMQEYAACCTTQLATATVTSNLTAPRRTFWMVEAVQGTEALIAQFDGEVFAKEFIH